MSFIGNVPAEAYSPVAKDTFSGDDSTTDFTLSIPATTNGVEVLVENVQQEPTTAYTISGTTLSFTAAPVTGTNNIYVIHRGPAVQTVVPPAGVAIDASTVTASSTISATGDISTEGDLKVEVTSGGIYTITGTDTATNRTLTLPDEAGTVITTAGVPSSALPEGSVLQVVSTTKTDVTSFVSTTTNTYVDISGMSVTITPTSATSKILVMYTAAVSQSSSATIHLRLYRGATSIGQGVASGNRLGDSLVWRPTTNQYNFDIGPLSSSFLDSPNTTSATTYKLAATLGVTYNGTFYLNRSWSDTDFDYAGRTASTITVMEIAGP